MYLYAPFILHALKFLLQFEHTLFAVLVNVWLCQITFIDSFTIAAFPVTCGLLEKLSVN